MNLGKAQKADLEWRNGAPVCLRFDDPYFSVNDGLAEARHVFLGGNGLPERFVEGFHIAELGFGSGLNLLAAWKAWEDAGMTTPLRFTSFEAYPMSLGEMAQALAVWPELVEYAKRLTAGGMQMRCETLELNVIIGDAREALPEWGGKADAWFLDGFSPAKNPELWSPEIMQAVGAHTAQGGTFATYTAAGHVRRALVEAGFSVARPAGHGNKRHMSVGVLL
ncbi:MAG: FAD-dependent oxidoreductase [Rhodobacteraceae bacterium]|nr:MAG: FAD-dependent oxidoreductase [Paracoccaceae bacterium]